MSKTKVKALIMNLMAESVRIQESTKSMYNNKMQKMSTEEIDSYFKGQLNGLYWMLTELEKK